MRDPRPPLLLAVALLVLALATLQPLIVAGVLIAAVLLYMAAPGPCRLMLRVAAVSGLFVLVVNPFVAVEGGHVLVAGPHFLLFDFEVTSEELLYGAVAGMRLATAILATSAFLALSDPDRVQALASRVAPRSALTVALSARLVPTLRRDAMAMHEALRLRGTGPAKGRTAMIRQSAVLVEPLIASSLERGIEISEAMAARGYGSFPLTALPEPPLARGERAALCLGAILFGLGIAVIAGGLPYAIYPVADTIITLPALISSLLIVVLSALAAQVLRRPA